MSQGAVRKFIARRRSSGEDQDEIPLPGPPRHSYFSTLRAKFPHLEFPNEVDTLFEDDFYLPPRSCFMGEAVPIFNVDENGVRYYQRPISALAPERVMKMARPNMDDDFLQQISKEDVRAYSRIVQHSRSKPSEAMSLERLFSNGIHIYGLDFKRTPQEWVLDEAERVINSVRECYIVDKRHLESAYLSVVALALRVMVVGQGYTPAARAIAAAAFPQDLMGPWDVVHNDVVVTRGFYAEPVTCQRALHNVQLTLHHLTHVPGQFKVTFKAAREQRALLVHPDRGVTLDWDIKVDWGVKVTGFPEKTLIFKPAFAQYCLRISSPKGRLTAEALQAAVITFVVCTNAALLRRDYGPALYFVQMLRRCIRYYSWLLNYKPLLSSYLFAVHKHLEGQCHFHLASNWKKKKGEYKFHFHRVRGLFQDFEVALRPIEKEFSASGCVAAYAQSPRSRYEMAKLYEKTIHFPTTYVNCLAQAYRGYHGIALCDQWLRSWNYKEEVTLIYFLKQIKLWKLCVQQDVNRGDRCLRLCQLMLVEDRLEKNLSEAALSPGGLACVNIMMAQVCHYKAAWLQTRQYDTLSVDHENDVRCIMWQQRLYSRRSRCVRVALLLLKSRQQERPLMSRTCILSCTKKLFADAVLQAILEQNQRRPVTQVLVTLMDLLPLALHPWLVPSRSFFGPTTYNLIVPQDETVHLNYIFAMLFYGTALIYFAMHRTMASRVEAEDADLKETFRLNGRYFLTLSMLYLADEAVAAAVVRTVADFALVFSKCFINPHVTPYSSPVGRHTAVVSCHSLLLPLLWELAASEDHSGDLFSGVDAVKVDEVHLPLSLEELNVRFDPDTVSLYMAALNKVQWEHVVKIPLDDVERTVLQRRPHTHTLKLDLYDVSEVIPLNAELDYRPHMPGLDEYGKTFRVEYFIDSQECTRQDTHALYTDAFVAQIIDNFEDKLVGPPEGLQQELDALLAVVTEHSSIILQVLKRRSKKVIPLVPYDVPMPSKISRSGVRRTLEEGAASHEGMTTIERLVRRLHALDVSFNYGELVSLLRGHLMTLDKTIEEKKQLWHINN